MGRYVFRLPDIGEGIAEAEVVAWHVKVGDAVEEDAPLADMMTDKATVEMESPVSGRIVELAGEVGDRVPIGAPLVVIETEGEAGDDAAGPVPAEVRERIEAENPDAGDAERVLVAQSHPPVRSGQAPTGSGKAEGGGRALASPAVRARAQALGVDLAKIRGGADGVIRHADLDAALTARAAPSPAGKPAGETGTASKSKPLSGAGEEIRVIGLRRRIAENMAASKRHIPHFSYVEEIDVTALEGLRAEMNAVRALRPGRGAGDGKLTVLPFLIMAICRTLPDFPMINARYDEEAGVVTRYRSVHLGIATQTDAGLMVPVIRDAQALGLGELAREIARLAAAARDGSAAPEELSGSTLTLTSLGPLGGIATTPVINRPEVAIIGPNRIVERPAFVPDGAGGDRLERRKLMNLSMSCDHRVVDGWDAASFVQALRRLLEAPLALLA